ncbi:MAG: UbiA family prenyltransferase [Methanomassiliicoccales archaeon]
MEGDDPFSRRIDALVHFMERGRLPLYGIFLYVVAVALIRDLSEYFLLDHAFVTTPHPWIYSIAHHVSFYLVVFLGLVLLLTAFSGRGLRRSTHFVGSFWWIVITPPYIDHFIFGWETNYAYFSPTDFLNALIHFSGETFHPGQGLEVAVVLFAVFGYAIWTQKDRLVTIEERAVTLVKVGLLIIFTFMALFFMATPGAYIPVGSTGGLPDFPAFDLTKYHQYHLFLVAWYSLIGLALMTGLAYMTFRGRFRELLESARPFQTLFFTAIVAAGLVAGWRGEGELELITSILDRPYWVNLEFVILVLITSILAWLVSTMWNDLSDRETDLPGGKRFLLSRRVHAGSFWHLSLVLATLSVALAYLLSIHQALIILAILGLSYIYSFQPFRFKDHLLSPLLIGLGTFLAFLFGSLTPFSQVDEFTSGGVYAPHLTGEVVLPSPGMEVFYIGLFMFIGLVVGSMVTDVDGYREDKRAGVRTVYTVLGLRLGVLYMSGVILLTALTPLAVFNQLPDLILFPTLGLLAALLFRRCASSRPVLLLALVGLIYAALRFLDLVTFS